MKTYSRELRYLASIFPCKENPPLRIILILSRTFMVFTLTREDASKMVGVSTRTIDRYIHAGKIRTKRDGKVIMLHKEDVTQVKGG